MRATPILVVLLAFVLAAPTLSASTLKGQPLVSGSPQTSAATTLYGPRIVVVQPADDNAFHAAFPSLSLYAVKQIDPTYGAIQRLMAWNPTLSKAYDVTTQFNSIMSTTGSVVSSTSDAIKYGRAYAATANSELEFQRVIAETSNSTQLGVNVTSPTASSPSLLTYTTVLTTWSLENGVLANWTVNFTSSSIQKATWQVVQVQVGPYVVRPDAILFQVGHQITDDYTGSGSGGNGKTTTGIVNSAGQLTAVNSFYMEAQPIGRTPSPPPGPVYTSTNPDGSNWSVNTPPGYNGFDSSMQNSISAWAQALATAGSIVEPREIATITSYDRDAYCANPTSNGWSPAGNMSYHITEADCSFAVTMTDPNALAHCSTGSLDSTQNVTIAVHPRIDLCLKVFQTTQNSQPLYHGANLNDIARVVIAHELFHAIQSYYGGYSPRSTVPVYSGDGEMYREAEAVLMPTLIAPDMEQRSDSFYTYWSNQFLLRTKMSPCWFDGAAIDDGFAKGDPRTPTSSPLNYYVRQQNSGYQYVAFWGWLAARANDSSTLMKNLIHQLQTGGNAGDSNCEAAFHTEVSNAMDLDANLHGIQYKDAVWQFALDLLGPNNMSWGGYNWGSPPSVIRMVGLAPGQNDTSDSPINLINPIDDPEAVGGWGFRYVHLTGTSASSTLYCNDQGDLAGLWQYAVVLRSASSMNIEPFTCASGNLPVVFNDPGSTLATLPGQEAYVVALRSTPSDGWVSFGLDVKAHDG